MTDIYSELRSLLSDVMQLQASLARAGVDEQQVPVGTRLANCVVRPLRLALGVGAADGEVGTPPDDLSGDDLGPRTAAIFSLLSVPANRLSLAALIMKASPPPTSNRNGSPLVPVTTRSRSNSKAILEALGQLVDNEGGPVLSLTSGRRVISVGA